jgi:hypothetical protein
VRYLRRGDHPVALGLPLGGGPGLAVGGVLVAPIDGRQCDDGEHDRRHDDEPGEGSQLPGRYGRHLHVARGRPEVKPRAEHLRAAELTPGSRSAHTGLILSLP